MLPLVQFAISDRGSIGASTDTQDAFIILIYRVVAIASLRMSNKYRKSSEDRYLEKRIEQLGEMFKTFISDQC